ncbi:hypothetical protein DFH27DRAFT_633910, partial [Peziza echinospora]
MPPEFSRAPCRHLSAPTVGRRTAACCACTLAEARSCAQSLKGFTPPARERWQPRDGMAGTVCGAAMQARGAMLGRGREGRAGSVSGVPPAHTSSPLQCSARQRHGRAPPPPSAGQSTRAHKPTEMEIGPALSAQSQTPAVQICLSGDSSRACAEHCCCMSIGHASPGGTAAGGRG